MSTPVKSWRGMLVPADLWSLAPSETAPDQGGL